MTASRLDSITVANFLADKAWSRICGGGARPWDH